MKLHLTILLWLAAVTTSAQQMTLRNFDRSTYHGGTQNWSITQGADGRMLFGNNHGLLTFDSDRWNLYPIANYSDVRSVFFDQEHNIILAGANQELGYYLGNNEKPLLQYYSLRELVQPKELDNVEVWNIYRWKQYAVFQNKNTIMLWDFKDRMEVIKTPYRIETSAIYGRGICIACKEAFYEYRDGQLYELANMERLRNKNIQSIIPYHGDLIIVTADDGLFLYHDQQSTPLTFDITPYLIKNQSFCAALQGDLLAIGTVRGGMVMKNLKTGSTGYVNTNHGLSDNTVLSIGFDCQHNIWMGLNNGIAYALTSSSYFKLLSNRIGTGCASLLMGNRLYLGTSQGLFSTPYPLELSPDQRTVTPIEGIKGQVWSLTQMGNSVLCGADRGAFVMRDGKLQRIEGVVGTLKLLPLSKHPDYILGCDYDGFFLLRKGSGSNVSFSNRLGGFSETSARFLEDADGSIWVSHWQKGIYHFRLSDDYSRVYDLQHFHQGQGLLVDNLNTLCQIQGRTYISSVDGLYQYDKAKRKLVLNRTMSDIFKKFGNPLTIYEMPNGDLWAYGDNYLALAHCDRGQFSVDSISYKAIFNNLQLAMGSPSFIGQQTLLNSNDGFYVAYRDTHPLPYRSRVFIRRIYSTNDGDSLLQAYFPNNQNEPLYIKHRQNSLRIEFVMPEYRDQHAVTYSFWLEGYDRGWSTPQTVNNKEYTHLPKGKYIFHIKAQNRLTGQINEHQLTIVVQPAWYESWWAYLLYIIIGICVLVMFVRLLKRRSEREVQRIRQEKERQMKEQEHEFQMEQARQEKEIAQQEKEIAQQEKELTQLRNEQLNVELKHKASQLADSTINLVRKNEMLQEIDHSMFELSEGVKHDEGSSALQRRIKDIRRGIEMHMNDDKNWQKFEENFNLVYDNFMKHLSTHYPDLKMNDRKLCAYLRMGLSSKEMASLLNTSVRSIETARYRLRKKLGMEQGNNLSEFIQSIKDIT